MSENIKRSQKVYGKRSRRTRRKGRPNPGKLALSKVKALERMARPETKYLDLGYSANSVSWTGTLIELCTPTQGVGVNSRVGDVVTLRGMTLKCTVGSTGANAIVRMIVFIDKENSITTPGQMLTVTGSALAPLSPKVFDNQKNFRVLCDRLIAVDTYSPQQEINYYFSLKNIRQSFDPGTALPFQNNLKIFWISNVGATTPIYSQYTRVTYMDA